MSGSISKLGFFKLLLCAAKAPTDNLYSGPKKSVILGAVFPNSFAGQGRMSRAPRTV
eukprot:COSAG01_NODE_54743_length_330_cov_0.636364_1_plen_56_part_10